MKKILILFLLLTLPLLGQFQTFVVPISLNRYSYFIVNYDENNQPVYKVTDNSIRVGTLYVHSGIPIETYIIKMNSTYYLLLVDTNKSITKMGFDNLLGVNIHINNKDVGGYLWQLNLSRVPNEKTLMLKDLSIFQYNINKDSRYQTIFNNKFSIIIGNYIQILDEQLNK